MISFVAAHFYALDFAIGIGLPAGLLALRAVGRVSRETLRLFWLGCAVGLSWEIPLSTLDGLGIVDVFTFLTPPPNFAAIIASHTMWDGGLFLAGVALVRIACPAPQFVRWRWRELAVLTLWGQAQELAVELTATGTAGWTYNSAWWNPPLFDLNGHHITLLPQAMWLAGTAVFYAMAVRTEGRPRPAPSWRSRLREGV